MENFEISDSFVGITQIWEVFFLPILDVVFNQADWQHPWYQMYEIWENPFFNATAPHA